MANRTTMATLEALVNWINKKTNSPLTPYTKTENGLQANIGNYYIAGAQGGYALYRMANNGGGVDHIFGYCTKRELEVQLRAYLRGLTDKEDVA